MQTVIETITPAKAVEYLGTSMGNRPISKVVVKSYADSMKQGKWAENGVTIIFDDGGHLLDGHHRMHAVILAGIPVRFLVCRGVQSDVFTTIDQGRNKNLGQLLAMQSVENYNCVASVVNGNNTLVTTGRLFNTNSAKTRGRSNTEYYEEYRRDPQGYDEATAFGLEVYRIGRIVRPSWIGALYYYLSHTGGYDEEYVKRFFESVCSLDTSGIIAADELRKFIIKNDRSGRKLEPQFLFAIICKAWNYYVDGKPFKVLRFDTEREVYPVLKLKTEN